MMNRKVFAILLGLFVFASPVLAWSATYYFDSVGGNDSTGVANNVNYPYKTIAELNSLLSHGTIQSGDVVSFKNGTSRYQQEFRGIVNVSPPAAAGITLNSYGSGSYLPVFSGTDTYTGWVEVGTSSVYTISNVRVNWIFEDHIPLPQASTSACSDGNWFFSVTSGSYGTLYYLPTTGVPGNHVVYGNVNASVYASSNGGITFDGLGFATTCVVLESSGVNLVNPTVTNCQFWGGASLYIRSFAGYLVINPTITNNTFTNSYGPSLTLATGDNAVRSGLNNLKITGNTITNNNMLPNGSAWIVSDSDVDAVYAQNWGTALFENNQISGNTGTGYFSSALQVYNALGNNGIMAVNSFTNNGSGLFRVHTTSTLSGLQTNDYVYIYGAKGTGAPNGKWQVIVIDVNDVDLLNSTYVAGCSEGSFYQEIPVSPDYTIRYNYIHDVRSGMHIDSGVGGIGASNHQINIYYNLLFNCAGYGINIARKQAIGQSSILNNSLLNCGTLATVESGFPGAALYMNGGDNLKIENNIVSGSCNLFAYDAAASGNNTWNYNDYYNASSGSVFRWGTTLQTWAAWSASRDIHSITSNPLFVSTSIPKLQLQSGSPCIEAGTNVGLTSDYAGNPVPSVPDIGAYEFVAQLESPQKLRLIE
jgi:hypothetical protein